ncbi:hypothetical protein DSL72_000232 [Monilinia vaccinii-corymbosi]|uniref:Uncharacterized protein n=1 Tax=Monilinia vaccinii-corymbosi TaxID=61207 RepID=A0A8A3P3V4_9HELO|nr:hypothetical protein DSL72_000232 [Monilinia vaccinii-corymbosi]
MDLGGELDNAVARKEIEKELETIDPGELTATEFLVRERRSLTDLGKGSRGTRRGVLVPFEDQRASRSRARRHTVGGNRHVSSVIEQGWEHHGENDGKANSSCVMSKGKKRWEDWWRKLKKI